MGAELFGASDEEEEEAEEGEEGRKGEEEEGGAEGVEVYKRKEEVSSLLLFPGVTLLEA